MPYSQYFGQKNKVLNTGRLAYGGDGTDAFPLKVLADSAGISGRLLISQREPFIFRPGSTALSSGMVASGTRSASGTVTSGTIANSTYYSSWLTYQPQRGGLIDGKSSGGIIDGQIAMGIKTGAGTGTAKLTVDIANTANTGSPTAMLTLTGAITCTTAEIFQAYDIPYLACDTVFNSLPFSVRMGVQTQQGGSTVIGRVMESSFIQGEFEPS